jgi:aerobic C4-dicarboxylate transport protein
MILLKSIFQHPAILLGSVLLGGWVGTLSPASAAMLAAVSTLYLSLIQMASLPFVILAVFFGLQRLPALPGSGQRLLLLAMLSGAAMLLCAVIGALVAILTSAGAQMSTAQSAILGRLALQSESQFVMALRGSELADPALWQITSLVPNNLFSALAYGSVPSALIGIFFFGLAVAVQAPGAASHLTAIFEGIYRALESLIERFNALLPLASFVLAAAATSAAGIQSIVLLSSFLVAFFVATAIMSALCIALIGWRLKTSPLLVLTALREPITVCLFSPVAVAAVPGFIEAMTVKLGFSRALVELVSPIAPFFIRAGEALFFAVLAIFMANLYGHALGLGDIALICLLSWAAALWSLGIVGVKSVVLGTFVLSSFGLPLEAVLPVFMLIEVLCVGARNLLSFLVSSALIALVCDGLYINHKKVSDAVQSPTLTLAFERKQALFGLVLVAIALLTVFCAGVGYGLRHAI